MRLSTDASSAMKIDGKIISRERNERADKTRDVKVQLRLEALTYLNEYEFKWITSLLERSMNQNENINYGSSLTYDQYVDR